MNGLPQVRDTSRPRDCWAVMVLGGLERLTEALMRGDAFDAQSLTDMEQLSRRLGAFDRALTVRKEAAQAVVE